MHDAHAERQSMEAFSRITSDPTIMGGKACIRGLRVTVWNRCQLLGSQEVSRGERGYLPVT